MQKPACVRVGTARTVTTSSPPYCVKERYLKMKNMTARGEPIPETVEAWKRHAYLMADLVEEQAAEIQQLRQRNNKLEQRLMKMKRRT